MKIKNILTSVLLSALAVTVLFAGYRMLSSLQEKKVRYNVDLYTLIPTDCQAVVHFKDARGYFSHPATAGFSAVLWDSLLNKLPANDLFLSLHPDGAVLYKKMAADEIADFLAPINSGLKTEKLTEDNQSIHIITTTDNRFFCYFHHEGVWIGSLRKRLISRVIENLSSPATLRKDTSFNQALKYLGDNAMANVVFDAENFKLISDAAEQRIPCSFPRKWMGFDLSETNGRLWLSGVIADNQTGDEEEKIPFLPELIPDNSFLAYQSCDGNSYDVCFAAPDSLSEGGRVKVFPIESSEHYNQILTDSVLPPATLIYNDYALFADSIAIIDAFAALLNNDSLHTENPLVKMMATFEQPKEDGLIADLGTLLCGAIPTGLYIPSWLREQKEVLAPYCLYYYTYTDDNKRFFNLILSPK